MRHLLITLCILVSLSAEANQSPQQIMDTVSQFFNKIQLDFSFDSAEATSEKEDAWLLSLPSKERMVINKDLSIFALSSTVLDLWTEYPGLNKLNSEAYDKQLPSIIKKVLRHEQFEMSTPTPVVGQGIDYFYGGLKDQETHHFLIVKQRYLLADVQAFSVNHKLQLGAFEFPSFSRDLLAEIDRIPNRDRINYRSKNPSYKLAIFTDPYCKYCATLHKDIPKLLEMGYSLSFIPRPGFGGRRSLAHSQRIMCSENPKRAMEKVFEKGVTAVPDAKYDEEDKPYCAQAIEKNFRTFSRFNLDGVPNIVLENGHILKGYLPPEKLKQYIDKNG